MPRASGVQVRAFLIDNLRQHPHDIVRLAAERFGCTRQAVHKHVQQLVADGSVVVSGQTRSKRYALAPLGTWAHEYKLNGSLTEDAIWLADLAPHLADLAANVRDVLHYGATEMLNNAIDHSGARQVAVLLQRTAAETTLTIHDDGEGIFKKIRAALGLADDRHAALELAKGKFTTDPARHSGEGIFFASRMFDRFAIASGEVVFGREPGATDAPAPTAGTQVHMAMAHQSVRTAKAVFDQFATEPDYAFEKTQVPMRLMRYGDDNLVSRSQARRLLARFEKFKVVELDFAGVDSIGQAFADEIFRVYRAQQPAVDIVPLNTLPDVARMISRARAARP